MQVQKEFISHNIIDEAAELYHTSGAIEHDISSFKESLETLDNLILDIQLKAESQCCLPQTKYNRSDKKHNYKIILNYWLMKRKKTTKNKYVRKVTLQIYSDLPETYKQYILDQNQKETQNAYGSTSRKMEQATKDSYDNEAAFLGTTSEQVKLKKD